jgi:very-short-patch-repair endonuclease
MPLSINDYVKLIQARSLGASRNSPLTLLRDTRSFGITDEIARACCNDESVRLPNADLLPLKRLYETSRTALRERGERSLHIIRGRFEMPWPQDPTKSTLAPIYILKAELIRSAQSFSLKAIDEDGNWELNPVINLLLKQTTIRIPNGNLPTKIQQSDFASVVQNINWLSSQCTFGTKVDPRVVLANISSSDIRIARLLTADSVARALANNQVVAAKLSNHTLSASEPPKGDTGIEDLGIVLPCDDSQLRVIQLSGKSLSLQVEGPPGTGKSQTIANIIANQILKGKKVLFVCDKAVAVEQVRERLCKVGLEPAVLFLHDEDTQRRIFIEQANLAAQPTNAADEAAISSLRAVREFLNNLWSKARSPLHSCGADVSMREGLGSLIRLKRELASDLLMLEIPGCTTVSFERLQLLKQTIEEWALMSGELADNQNPWNNVRGEFYEQTPAADNMLQTCIADFGKALEKIPELRERLLRLGASDDPTHLSTLTKLRRIASLIRNQPPEAQSILACDEVGEKPLVELRDYWNERRTIETTGHPIQFPGVGAKRLESEIKNLKHALPSLPINCSWADLGTWSRQAAADIMLIEQTVSDLERLSAATGCAKANTLDRAVAACIRFTTLRSTYLPVPTGWWVSTCNPVDVIARLKSRMGELSTTWSRSPWRQGQMHAFIQPNNLRLLLSISDADFAPILECVEKADEILGRLFRPSRKGKNILRNLYGTRIPLKMDGKDWDDLCHHAVELRRCVLHLHAVALEIPFLQPLVDELLTQPSPASLKNVLSNELITRASTLATQVIELRALPDMVASPDTAKAYWTNPLDDTEELVTSIKSNIDNRLLHLSTEHRTIDLSDIRKALQEQVDALEKFTVAVITDDSRPEILLDDAIRASKRHDWLVTALKRTVNYASLVGKETCWNLATDSDWQRVISHGIWRDELLAETHGQEIEITPHLWTETENLLSSLDIEIREIFTNLFTLFSLEDEILRENFTISSHVFGQISLGMTRRSQWLRKSYWKRCTANVPELLPLWSKFADNTIEPKSAWKIFLFNFIHKCGAADGSRGAEHAGKVNEFKELDSKLTQISITRIQSRVRKLQQDAARAYPAGKSSVQHYIGMARIARSIREILLSPGVTPYLTTAKPCWMMSPASLSAYLGEEGLANGLGGETTFDCVIFDEASQMRVMEAVYCMAYAKQTIIVGDKKQLPPTSFFRGSAMDNEDDDEAVESVLEEFGGVFERDGDNATMVSLLSHYRSETPDLIAFNNQQFYADSLEICPPRTISGQGLRMVHVQDGRFIQRKNEAEAQKVIELIAEHARLRPANSLGVVVMNYEQMERIETLLERAGQEVASMTGNPQQFFLRNLETVQGDEADYIILALTYGKGEQGTFSANVLGPITKSGGHRRLNVATSRSKLGMTVITSLLPEDLSSSTATSEGFKCFQDLLKYLRTTESARNFGITNRSYGSNSQPAHALLACDSEFEVEVAEFLGSKGIEVLTQYGAGRYRIDLVVRESGRNILAIECDGAAYHSTWTARTRDRARQLHLESKGWRFHRIWSRNWFHNREEECANLMTAIFMARTAVRTQGQQV